jgi:hypothetical protein
MKQNCRRAPHSFSISFTLPKYPSRSTYRHITTGAGTLDRAMTDTLSAPLLSAGPKPSISPSTSPSSIYAAHNSASPSPTAGTPLAPSSSNSSNIAFCALSGLPMQPSGYIMIKQLAETTATALVQEIPSSYWWAQALEIREVDRACSQAQPPRFVDPVTNQAELDVCVRIIDIDKCDEVWETLHRETALVMSLNHQNLITIRTTFVHAKQLWIVFDYYQTGTCHRLLHDAHPTGK